jgi:hypothetical protein
MSESFSEAFVEAEGVSQTALDAGAAVSHAASGEWDNAAGSALSMSESALGVATLGVTTAAEAGWDAMAQDAGLPSAHDGLNQGAAWLGNEAGSGLESLVGDDQAHQSAVAFDDGDIAGGLGHMVQGAAGTVGGAVEQGMSDAGQAVSDAASAVGQGAADLWNEATQ